jgi:hypothetical protein
MTEVMVRQLKVKCDVVDRLRKDIAYYNREADEQRAHVQKLVSGNADPYDVRQQQKVLDETTCMLPDCTTRLNAALDDLREHFDAVNAAGMVVAPELTQRAEQTLNRIE